MIRTLVVVCLLVHLATAASAGLPWSPVAPVETGGGTDHAVTILGTQALSVYLPPVLRIEVGDTVHFQNRGDVNHTATDTAGAWDTGNITRSSSLSLVFTEPGEYLYHCDIHENTMKGILVVSA